MYNGRHYHHVRRHTCIENIFPVKWKRINELLQLICTLLLIFSMGVMLGSREDFLDTITTLGSQSILFFLIPSVFSVIAVYPLTKNF